MKIVSIIIPVYFNEQNLPHLFGRLTQVARQTSGFQFEFIFVEDGSTDSSYELLCEFAGKDDRAKIVKLSRNFGSFTAAFAGLCHCTGDCAVIMAADLQDPPELIIKMLDQWLLGNDVVIAARKGRAESLLKRTFAGIYYRLMRRYALPDMPKGGFDFVLIDRKVVDVVSAIKEKNTSLMALILWTGFKRNIMYYERRPREHGRSMWTMGKKVKYLIDSFVAFSYAPIRLMQYLGIIIAILGFLYSILIAFQKIFYGFPVPGLSALVIIVLLIGGVQLIMLGVIGEYLWRNVDETKKRPPFIVDEIFSKDSSDKK